MRALRIEPEAEEELGTAMQWYEAKQSGLGAALLAEVLASLSGCGCTSPAVDSG